MLLTIVSLVCCVFAATDAFSGGAPSTTCDSLTPLHRNFDAQITEVPFAIDLSQFETGNGTYEYTPGKTYTITLEQLDSTTFRGFFVQSRLMSDGKTRVGIFSVTAQNTRLSSCPIAADGVTHVNNGSTKIDFTSIEMGWTAPSPGTGPIYFAFTVVNRFDTFWVNEESEVLVESSNAKGVFFSVPFLLLALLLGQAL